MRAAQLGFTGFSILALAAALGLACADVGESIVLSALQEVAPELSPSAAQSTAPPSDGAVDDAEPRDSAGSAAAAPEPGGPQTYYQYVDATGAVRFVADRELVPPAWRERAGEVQLVAAPTALAAAGASAGTAAKVPAPEAGSAGHDARAALARRLARASRIVGGTPRNAQPDVVIYYADWCPYCRRAKTYLDERAVDYELKDIDEPSNLEDLIELTGRKGIPVLEIGGQVVHGFDQARIDELLAGT